MIVEIWEVFESDGGILNSFKNYEGKLVTGGIFSKYSELFKENKFFIYYNHEDKLFQVVDTLTGTSIGKGTEKHDALSSARVSLNSTSTDSYELAVITTLIKKVKIKQSNKFFQNLKIELPKTKTFKEKVKKTKTEKKVPARALVFKKTNGKCFYCNESLLIDGGWHIEHMHPISRGGSNDISNLVPSCPICNLTKNTKTAKEFLEASA